MTIPTGTQVTWSGPDASSGIIWSQNGNNLRFYLTQLNQEAVFTISVTNSCGSFNVSYKFRGVSGSCGGNPLLLIVSPNPTEGSTVQTTLIDNADNTKKKDILSLKIIDRMGNIKSIVNYNTGTKTITLDVSWLNPDIYTISAFDGQRWTSTRFIKD